ncbi:cyclin-U4-1-like [Cynara cardunculus var. scolymus]|uniref:Cyclin n=1 Tax=Cynara cardunculus var. scolymus TaxID=59895 RepID=A0A103Y107_CYNCS|nr:cyclin-U4-1-like [Cynara cardunculus var. scolymus]KVI00544.1 Cyclin-like protein [Cynara cardunculus var. scolymus]
MAELECPTVMSKLISYLSSLLQRVAESNDLNPRFHPQKISAFHGLTRPTISIQTYLERIFKYANCSPSCYVVAYVYLDRFTQQQPALSVNSFNVHRLLITSVMVAAKFMDDMYYNNAYYAKVGGISTTEMNFLEVDFLFGLGFQLNVNPTTFHTYCSYLQKEMFLLQPPPNIEELSSSSYKSRSTKLLHYEDDQQQQQQEVVAV